MSNEFGKLPFNGFYLLLLWVIPKNPETNWGWVKPSFDNALGKTTFHYYEFNKKVQSADLRVKFYNAATMSAKEFAV